MARGEQISENQQKEKGAQPQTAAQRATQTATAKLAAQAALTYLQSRNIPRSVIYSLAPSSLVTLALDMSRTEYERDDVCGRTKIKQHPQCATGKVCGCICAACANPENSCVHTTFSQLTAMTRRNVQQIFNPHLAPEKPEFKVPARLCGYRGTPESAMRLRCSLYTTRYPKTVSMATVAAKNEEAMKQRPQWCLSREPTTTSSLSCGLGLKRSRSFLQDLCEQQRQQDEQSESSDDVTGESDTGSVEWQCDESLNLNQGDCKVDLTIKGWTEC